MYFDDLTFFLTKNREKYNTTTTQTFKVNLARRLSWILSQALEHLSTQRRTSLATNPTIPAQLSRVVVHPAHTPLHIPPTPRPPDRSHLAPPQQLPTLVPESSHCTGSTPGICVWYVIMEIGERKIPGLLYIAANRIQIFPQIGPYNL